VYIKDGLLLKDGWCVRGSVGDGSDVPIRRPATAISSSTPKVRGPMTFGMIYNDKDLLSC
jgi:hypothetical protein